MKLSSYKKLFERNFEKSIRPSKNLYSYIKTNEDKYSYSIGKKSFYYQNPPISVDEKENKLDVYVKPHNIKTLYLSYLTLDTNFSEIPAESFVNIEYKNHFYLDMDIATGSNIEVIPYIIHYNDKGKKRGTRITKRNQFIEVSQDEFKVRLTFKIKGNGKFTIKSITMIN